MSDLGWAAIVVILLAFVGLLFIFVWHGGEKPNGLKGDLEERVTMLENENTTIWIELKRLADRWIP
jgi:hypothetical protein